MGKLLKVLLGILVPFVLVFSLTYYWYQAIPDNLRQKAESFFESVKKQEYAPAYAYCSSALQTKSSQDDLIRFLNSSRLVEYKKASWPIWHLDFNTRVASLEGKIETNSDLAILLSLEFVREQGEWKIFSIKPNYLGSKTSEEIKTIPSQEELVKLFKQSLERFSQSIAEKNMKTFYEGLSSLWQSRGTLEDVEKSFAKLMANPESRKELAALANQEPIFEKKEIYQEGSFYVLDLKVYYGTKMGRVLFEAKYVYEYDGWKLLSWVVK